MPKEGFFIYYIDWNKQPNQKWIDSNEHFTKLKEIENIIIYKYVP